MKNKKHHSLKKNAQKQLKQNNEDIIFIDDRADYDETMRSINEQMKENRNAEQKINLEKNILDDNDDFHGNEDYFLGLDEYAISENYSNNLEDNYDDLVAKSKHKKEILEKHYKIKNNVEIDEEVLNKNRIEEIEKQKLNDFDKKGKNQMTVKENEKTEVKEVKKQNVLGKHKKVILGVIGYAILLGGAFFGAISLAKKEKNDTVQIKQQTQIVKENKISSSPVSEIPLKVEDKTNEVKNEIIENKIEEISSSVETQIVEKENIVQNFANSTKENENLSDLDVELQELEKKKAQLENERLAFIQKEREMQEKIEKAKREKQEKERLALIEKAKAKKEEVLLKFDKNINDLTDEIVKKKDEISHKKEEIQNKLKQVNVLFDKQITDLNMQSQIIAEQEEKLRVLKEKQIENEKLIKANFTKDVELLVKEQETLAKSKDLEEYEKDIRSKISKIKELRGVIETTSLEEILKLDLESDNFKTLEAPILKIDSEEDNKISLEKNNDEIENQKNENIELGINNSMSNLKLDDLDTSKIKNKKENSNKMSEEEKEEFSKEVKNLNENYDKNSKNLNLKKDEDNEVKTDWLGSTIKRSQDPNKYDRYGSWVEVKTKNKL